MCRITKDSIAGHAGELIVLREWQKQLLRHLLAVDADGNLVHKVALIGMPRKNGKSALLGGITLEHLIFGVSGGEAYSCAAEKEQAKIIFDTVKQMIGLDDELKELLIPLKDVITNPKTNSVYRALSAEAYTKEGLNPTFTAFDELHAQPSRDLWDVMGLAQGSRVEPMLCAVTTAGVKTDSSGKDSICYQQYQYGMKLASGEIEDPSYFFAWWGADETDDFRSEETWRKANPGYDDIISATDFRSVIKRTTEAEFKTKRLNIWTSTATAWLPDGSWSAIELPNREPIQGEQTFLCFDGAFSNDSTALLAWKMGGEQPHLSVIDIWERPDDADQSWHVPVAEVEAKIIETCRNGLLNVKEIVFDPARWQRTFMVLDEDGLPVVAYPNSATNMVPATAKFYEGVMNKSFTHDGDPRLARHVANCVTKQSSRGAMVAKASSRQKVDAAVAAIFGYDRATTPQIAPPEPARYISLSS